MWYDSIAEKIKNINTKVKKVEIVANPDDTNNIIGHKKVNIERLKEFYDIDVLIKPNDNIKHGKFEINVVENYNQIKVGFLPTFYHKMRNNYEKG